jgi:hypothetical protein
MTSPWLAFRGIVEELRPPGLIALVLIVLSGSFYVLQVKPLEVRNAELKEQLERRPVRPVSRAAEVIRVSVVPERMQAFYRFFDRPESKTDWLAKLHVIGEAVGVELRAAEYQLDPGKGRIERYQISLPVSGNYAQIRAFVENALIEIPVMSLDQVSFRKKRTADASVDAEIRLTLHLLRP